MDMTQTRQAYYIFTALVHTMHCHHKASAGVCTGDGTCDGKANEKEEKEIL